MSTPEEFTSNIGPTDAAPVFSLAWSADDDGWVATCSALESLSFVATTPETALAGLISLIHDIETTDTLVARLVPNPKDRCSLDRVFELLQSPHHPISDGQSHQGD